MKKAHKETTEGLEERISQIAATIRQGSSDQQFDEEVGKAAVRSETKP
jgi:hypothetical protein